MLLYILPQAAHHTTGPHANDAADNMPMPGRHNSGHALVAYERAHTQTHTIRPQCAHRLGCCAVM
jgi:hypothetical protein